MSNFFIKKLQNFIFQEKLLDQEDKVIVGISGGSDSIGLALALKKLKLKYKLQLQLVHINYHQRGDESNEDEKFVVDFAKKNDLELKVIQYDGTIISGNLEEQLRDFRYQQFEEIRKESNFDKIAVAHHLDDQVETFLMNLLRGSGVQGLTGMKPKRGFLIRPFLNFTKIEVQDFLKENQQEFRTDKTNSRTDFTRNSIRMELIPFLEKKYNLNIKEGLGKLVNNLQNDNELNKFFIDNIYADSVIESEEKVIWNISNLRKTPSGAINQIFRRIILRLKGDLKNISQNNFKEFKKIIESKKPKKQRMQIGGVVLEKSGECVIFKKAK